MILVSHLFQSCVPFFCFVVSLFCWHNNKKSRMVRFVMDAEEFEELGKLIMWRHNKNVKSRMMIVRQFRAFFGTSPANVAIAWNRLAPFIQPEYHHTAQPRHLLWGLMFMKLYNSSSVLASFAGVSEKTFQEWQWQAVGWLADLEYYCVSTAINQAFCNLLCKLTFCFKDWSK